MVDDERYEAAFTTGKRNTLGEPASTSPFAIQDAELDGTEARLARLSTEFGLGTESDRLAEHREMVRQQITQAYYSCRNSWYCRETGG
jgi:hypothetical protein